MFISTRMEIPEVITGGVGLVIVSAAFITSIMHNKKQLQNQIKEIVETKNE